MRIIFKVPEKRKLTLIADAKSSKKTVEGFYYVGCKLIFIKNKLIVL
jgi:hypothetical protein